MCSISQEAMGAVAIKRTVRVCTFGGSMTVMGSDKAFVDI